MRFARYSLIFSAFLYLLPAHAELSATPLSGDARLVTFDYDPDNTYLVLTKPRAVTHLEFPEEDRVQTMAAGDTTNWEFSPTKDRRHIFIKARIENASTTMTVITEKRSYQFVIRATGEGSKWYQRVTWRLPNTVLLDEEPASVLARPSRKDVEPSTDGGMSINPEKIRSNYVIEGNAPFRPVSVFDDGKMMWLQLPPGLQELPIVLATDESGEYMLVNYIPKGDYLLIQRLVEKMVLKIGKTEVKIARGVAKKSWFGRGRDEATLQGIYGH